MDLDFSNEFPEKRIKIDKIEFSLSDEMIVDSANSRAELMKKSNNLSFELNTFSDFGKSKLKEIRLHPDAFVQVNIQIAAYKTHRR